MANAGALRFNPRNYDYHGSWLHYSAIFYAATPDFGNQSSSKKVQKQNELKLHDAVG